MAGKTSLQAGNPGTQLHGGRHAGQQKARRQHLSEAAAAHISSGKSSRSPIMQQLSAQEAVKYDSLGVKSTNSFFPCKRYPERSPPHASPPALPFTQINCSVYPSNKFRWLITVSVVITKCPC